MKKNLMAMFALSSVLAATPVLTSCVDSSDAIESLRETEALTKKDSYIKAVYASYNEAYTNLKNSKIRKNSLTYELERLKNGLATSENLANKQIEYYQNVYNVESAKLETYHKFRMTEDFELEKKYAELDVKKQEALNNRTRTEKAMKDTYELRTSSGTYSLIDIYDVKNIINEAKKEPLALLKAAYDLAENFSPDSYYDSFYTVTIEDLCKHATYRALYINYDVIKKFKKNNYEDLTNKEKTLFDECYEILNSYTAKNEYEDMVSKAKAAGKVYDQAYYDYDKAYAEFNAVKDLLYNLVNISDQISNCENNIINALNRIEAYKKNIFDTKATIEEYTFDIKSVEERIAIEKILVANWAARIREATGDVVPTEPEAPAEPAEPTEPKA